MNKLISLGILALVINCGEGHTQTPVAGIVRPSSAFLHDLATKYRDHRFKMAILIKEHQSKVAVIIENTSLYYYYLNHKKNYTSLSFDTFLKKVIKGEILLNATDVAIPKKQEVNLSSQPILLYQNKGIHRVIDYYFDQDSQKRLVIKKEFSGNEEILKALIYLMFSNNYFVQCADYSGYWYCFK